IPADTFRLFITSAIVNARFGTLLAAVHTLALAVLGTCAVTRPLTFDGRKLLRFAVITVLLTIAVVGATGLLLRLPVQRSGDQEAVLSGMTPLRDRGSARVF